MELLPIIYNSLLIAAGLFVITIAISYVSYKIKQGKGTLGEREEIEYNSVFKDKKRVEEELRPHHKTNLRKPSSGKSNEKQYKKKEEVREKPRSQARLKLEKPKKVEPKKEIDKRSTERIERVRDLVPPEKKNRTDERKVVNRPSDDEETKKKKKLKSIDDDPLNKYTDSADDDLHPLKTDN